MASMNTEIASDMDMDFNLSALIIASGIPLTTIPELPGDENEFSDVELIPKEEERMRAMLFDDIFIPGPDSTSESRPNKPHQRLSINMSSLSPFSHSACSPMFSSSSPPSATYSSCSSAVSSPGSAFSPILNSFQWTSDLRQFILTDIGPQPCNSQVLGLRNHGGPVRRKSYSKIGGPGFVAPTQTSGMYSRSRNGSIVDLRAIAQDTWEVDESTRTNHTKFLNL
ncbi:hypothetical protein BC939DRAFT_440455 [Gamsiella multidivaricata]|uniref:uncharacterized protein n=1 Tax=Gamsiella multidivaricata TaxID=101098 RepID=UPI00222060F8|nr:uncharacterized protein BC939DRAFT_440455 [Gamsiella multidivaricata]KAI7829748.1 hypothetical protein BC939DRAFT_440455 [Gamsiella multidivaricata]